MGWGTRPRPLKGLDQTQHCDQLASPHSLLCLRHFSPPQVLYFSFSAFHTSDYFSIKREQQYFFWYIFFSGSQIALKNLHNLLDGSHSVNIENRILNSELTFLLSTSLSLNKGSLRVNLCVQNSIQSGEGEQAGIKKNPFSSKFTTSGLRMTALRKWKGKPQTGENIYI